MAKPVDLVIGSIQNMEHDRCAGWSAFYKADYENEELREEIAKLKAEIRRLKNGLQKPGQLGKRNLSKR